MAKKISPPRGMNDVLPVAAQRREALIRQLTPIYSKWGFMPIECPAMENIDRLMGSNGGDNEKLIFQVLRRGLDASDYERSLAEPGTLIDMGLRYDLTVPLARFYASNNSQLPRVCKFLQYGSVWRAERPQKGRFRQFMQWDADIIGAEEGLAEIELLLCTAEALAAIGLQGFVIRHNDRRILRALMNSVGITDDRHEEAFITIDKLDKIGIGGVEKEMLERNFSPNSVTQLVNKLAPFIHAKATSIEGGLDALNINLEDETRTVMSEVFNQVKANINGGSIVFDPTLVRGMGYYTGQIFEVEYEGYSFSIAGGGRYDGMIGRFLGKNVPACGFSLGFDRILTILTDKDMWPNTNKSEKLILLAQKNDISHALKRANTLRAEGWDVNLEFKAKNVKNQLLEYKAVGYSHFSIVDASGSSEIRVIS